MHDACTVDGVPCRLDSLKKQVANRVLSVVPNKLLGNELSVLFFFSELVNHADGGSQGFGGSSCK